MYPEKEEVVPIKYVKTATWSHIVNSEGFVVAEASDVLEMRLPDPSANLASISSAKRLKVRDNVKRFDTIFAEILEKFSDLTEELKRTDDHLPPASGAFWAPLQSCWSALSRVSKSSDNQELPRPVPLLTNKDSTWRIH